MPSEGPCCARHQDISVNREDAALVDRTGQHSEERALSFRACPKVKRPPGEENARYFYCVTHVQQLLRRVLEQGGSHLPIGLLFHCWYIKRNDTGSHPYGTPSVRHVLLQKRYNSALIKTQTPNIPTQTKKHWCDLKNVHYLILKLALLSNKCVQVEPCRFSFLYGKLHSL